MSNYFVGFVNGFIFAWLFSLFMLWLMIRNHR